MSEDSLETRSELSIDQVVTQYKRVMLSTTIQSFSLNNLTKEIIKRYDEIDRNRHRLRVVPNPERNITTDLKIESMDDVSNLVDIFGVSILTVNVEVLKELAPEFVKVSGDEYIILQDDE